MLKILGLITILIIHTGNKEVNGVFSQKSIWLEDYEDALKKAKEEKKPILVYFSGSDWCKPCIMLKKEVFEERYFRDFSREYLVLLKLDFPRYKKNRLSPEQTLHNERLAEKFNKEGKFPNILLLDSNEKVVTQTGYRPGGAKAFVNYLQKYIK